MAIQQGRRERSIVGGRPSGPGDGSSPVSAVGPKTRSRGEPAGADSRNKLTFDGGWPLGRQTPSRLLPHQAQWRGRSPRALITIDEARRLSRDSRPGSYTIVEVRDFPGSRGQPVARNWGHMIHPHDGAVVLDPADAPEWRLDYRVCQPLEAPSFQTRPLEIPIRTILDPRFPQPGRYSEFGVPQVLRPAADVLYKHSSIARKQERRRPVGGICTSEADGALVRGCSVTQPGASVPAHRRHRLFLDC